MVNRLSKDRGPKPTRPGQFVYKPRSVDQIKKRADNAGGRFDSIFKPKFDVYRTKAGENAVRILPPTWDNHEHFGYDIWVHKYVGPDESNYLCRFKMLNKACAWCDAAKEAKEHGDSEEFKKLSAKPDVVYWILDRDDESPMPQLWHISGMADGEISDLGRSQRTGKPYYLDHPDAGWDVLIMKKGAKLRTRYTYQRDAEAGPTSIVESKKKQQEILDFIVANPLPDVLKFYDNSYLQKLAEGGAHERDEDLDEDEPRSKKSRKHDDEDEDEDRPTKSRRGKSEEEEEEDNGEEDNGEEGSEDEEDNDRPTRGRSKRRSSRDDDEAEEEAGEEEEEEVDEEADEEAGEEEDDGDKPRGRRTKSRSRKDEDEEEENGNEEGEEEDGSEDEGSEDEDDEEERPRGRRGSSRAEKARKPQRRVASRRR